MLPQVRFLSREGIPKSTVSERSPSAVPGTRTQGRNSHFEKAHHVQPDHRHSLLSLPGLRTTFPFTRRCWAALTGKCSLSGGAEGCWPRALGGGGLSDVAPSLPGQTPHGMGALTPQLLSSMENP